MNVLRLFGTDGIRGEVCINNEQSNLLHLKNLYNNRIITPLVMAIIGYSVGRVLRKSNLTHETRNDVEYEPFVVIGWDRRPSNQALVIALSVGLKKSGCKVCWAGEIPTPGLQYCVLTSNFDAGFMITASHNPYTDSGVKLFDENGYKSMPNIEDIISELAWDSSKENILSLDEIKTFIPDTKIDGLTLYKASLSPRLKDIQDIIGGKVTLYGEIYSKNTEFYVDSSGGSATEWLTNMLRELGLNAFEVSNRNVPINQSCGAGDFSPTSSWKWEDFIKESHEHVLLKKISEIIIKNNDESPWEIGQIIGAALDGDGDRCLLFEVTNDGMKIVNGDQITDEILRAAYSMPVAGKWEVASTIEADMGLTASMERFSSGITILETAVGDRWLSNSLRTNIGVGKFLKGNTQPKCIGCEDSGHIVMPVRHPQLKNNWSLVGDGIMTLLSVISARVVINNEENNILPEYEKGWKKRISVKGTDRSKWDGKNELSKLVIQKTNEILGSRITNLKIESIYGENNLLLIKSKLNNNPISIGIRNSGTEAKTSISVRSAPNIDSNSIQKLNLLIENISHILRLHLCK